MFKKSIIIVLIQIFGSVLGLLTIYLIAGDMEPEVYSLTGIYTIMATITLTFSDLGIETTMTREALYWRLHGDEDKVREYTSQAILSRFLAFTVIVPGLIIYALIINQAKYEGRYTLLLVLFVVGAAVNTINNAMSLIVRSLGGYVFSQAASTLNNYILKFAGIGIYFLRGSYAYLVFYGLSSIPLSFVYVIKLHSLVDFRKMNIKTTLKKVIAGRYLWLKTDLDYFKNNADGMLVSALFPAGVMGSYSIYKQLEQLSKNVVEGFFDVLSQHTVKYKGQKDELVKQEKRIKKARNVIIAMIIATICVFSIHPRLFVELIHLGKYQSIDLMLYCILLVTIAHVIGKFEINAIAFFGTSKMNFNIGVAIFGISCLSYVIVMIMPSIYGVLSQRIIIYVITSILSIVLFEKNKEELYTKVLK